MPTSSSSWRSMVAIVGASFQNGITVFTELLGVVLGVNCTAFLLVVEVLVVSTFGVIVNLDTVDCTGGVCFGGIC